MCTRARRFHRTSCRWSPRACSCRPRCVCCTVQPAPHAALTGTTPFSLTLLNLIWFAEPPQVLVTCRHAPWHQGDGDGSSSDAGAGGRQPAMLVDEWLRLRVPEGRPPQLAVLRGRLAAAFAFKVRSRAYRPMVWGSHTWAACKLATRRSSGMC
jgi:hypothetical protein